MVIKEISAEAISNLKRFDADALWFDVHYKELQNKYKGNLVLVINKEVKAYAPTMELLNQKAIEKGIDIRQHLVEYIPEKECIKIFHLN